MIQPKPNTSKVHSLLQTQGKKISDGFDENLVLRQVQL